jgi:hypothetical protein
MTTLLPHPARPSADELRRDLRHRRPLVLLATLSGAAAAAGTLLVCLALGVLGWFLSDAGAHGTPRDGLRVGALGWLLGHGSGVHVQGTLVTAVPLGITLVCAWVVARLAHRLGDAVSGHGPDAERIADGERDWTVPAASVLFAVGYAAVALLAVTLAATAETRPDESRVVIWSLVLCLLVGVPYVAIGSGRAAIWTATLPSSVVATAAACRRVLRLWVLAALVALVVAFALDADTALNLLSQLDAGTTGAILMSVVSLLVVPNAVVFSGSYLLGPGFAVGTGTVVSPGVVTIGALPVFPLLAALPDNGPVPSWTPALMAVPVLVAALGAARAQRDHPAYRWEEGALHGCGGGMLAGAVFGILATLAGGAVGPGRMSQVAPFAGSVLLHAIVAFGIGGLLGGLVATWWQRRGLEPEALADAPDEEAVDEDVDEDTDEDTDVDETAEAEEGGAEPAVSLDTEETQPALPRVTDDR